MNQVRVFLLFAWVLVGILLWEAWERDYGQPAAPAVVQNELPVEGAIPTADRPAELPDAAPPAVESAPAVSVSAEPVVVTTDLLRLEIDPQGATVRRAELLGYTQTTAKDSPLVELLSPAPGRSFLAQSGWVSNTHAAPSHQDRFASEKTAYSLGDADELVVPFTWTGPDGLRVTREFVFRRNSYAIVQRDIIDNGSDRAWQGNSYHQLLREPPPVKSGFTNPEAYSFVGAAWYTQTDKFNKLAFDDFTAREAPATSGTQSWSAMLQHYFFAAWIPPGDESSRITTGKLGEQRYFIRSLSPALQAAPGAQAEHRVQLYVGPKLQGHLEAVAPGLELVIDYGVLTVLAEPMFALLSLFHQLTGNWGWAIVLLVVLLKLLFFKLSEAQYKSFAKMRRVQPRIEALKERYGDDRQKFNMAMMELYKKEKINPMGGCLPILVQIPVFIALYWVLLESVELRHAPWFGWIQNLSAPDPYFILPALNLVTMWLTQKLSPAPGMDPLQKKMMQAMPLVFGVMFAFFPAGLVLYWTVNGALGLLQQWVITRRHGEPVKA